MAASTALSLSGIGLSAFLNHPDSSSVYPNNRVLSRVLHVSMWWHPLHEILIFFLCVLICNSE